MKSRSALALFTTAAMTVAITGIATPSFADDSPASGQSADATASLIADVAPSQGAVDDSAALPADPNSTISVSAESGPDLAISLPQDLALGDGEQADDGTMVFPSSRADASAAVQQLVNGATRAQTVIGNSSAPTTFSYGFGNGFRPYEDTDGNFWVAGVDDSGKLQTFSVAAAWARDANGDAVPTHYEIRGEDLVQVVTPGVSAAYPIVADPTWEWYDFTYGVGFNKSETKNLAGYGSAAGFCGALLKWKIAAAVCGVAAADWLFQAKRAANSKSCIFISVAPPVAVFWESKGCK